MKSLIEKEKTERGKALFEIVLMVVSIVAIAYFLGDEFKIVSAADGTPPACTEAWTCGDWGTCSNSGTQTRSCSDTNNCGRAPAEESQGCLISGGGSFMLCSNYNMLAKLCTSSQTCTGTTVSSDDAILGKTCCVGDCKDAESPFNLGTLTSLGLPQLTALIKPAAAAPAASAEAQAAAAPYGPGPGASPTANGEAAGGLGVNTAPAAVPASFDKFLGSVWKEGGWMLINAGIAAALYWVFSSGIVMICPSCDAAALQQIAPWIAGGYLIGAETAGLLAIIGDTFNIAALSSLGGPVSALIGVGIALLAAAIWWIFVGKHYTEIIQFTCQPWQPQTGGSNCKSCNNKEFPCTEYKCKSLGINCQLLNPGTSNELCDSINVNDITPPYIVAWEGALQDNFTYQPLPEDVNFPADKGVYVNYAGSSDNCAPPFAKITFGVNLSEPGQCRADINRTDSYNKMTYKLSSNQYRYTHGILVVNPSKESLEAADLTEPNGGSYQLFVRCQDGHDPANQNVATFVFKYCIQQQEDTSPPAIQMTSPINGWPIQNNKLSQDVQIYVNKPSTCKWDKNDLSYDKMVNTMACASDLREVGANMLYECDTTLTGLKNGVENDFYIKCSSYNGHVNQKPYVYKLIGTQPLVLDSVTVNGMTTGSTIKDASQSVKVTFDARTSAGYNNGVAKCQLKQKSESSYVDFFNTNSYESTQDLSLGKGGYTYNVQCCDIGGNCQTKDVSFTVDTDFQSPIVVRAYNEANSLKIETSENAECVYSTSDGVGCGYTFEDGLPFTTSDNINHLVDWDPSTNFYVKCKDAFGNQPLPNQCSITVRPFNS